MRENFVFECPKLEDLRITYMALGDIMRPNVYITLYICYTTMIQTHYIAWQKLHFMV